jgi:hypothetical protein
VRADVTVIDPSGQRHIATVKAKSLNYAVIA